MTTNSQRSEFVFEALEPRLLLSADGLSAAGIAPEIERDVIAQEGESTVVIAYAIESTSSNPAETADAGDDIFDVAGQTMEAAVEASEPAADSVVEASVEAVSSTDSGASGTEPVALYSVYDGGSATSEQLVETLKASNAPPSEVDGSAPVSILSSLVDSDETGDLQMQALSVLPEGESPAPTIEAFETGSLDDNLNAGLGSLIGALWDLIAGDSNFTDPHLPGLRDEEATSGHASPTVLDAFAINVNQFGDSSEYLFSFNVRSLLNGIDLVGVHGVPNFDITGLLDIAGVADALYKTVPPDSPGLLFLLYTALMDAEAPVGPERAVQPALALMDQNLDGKVNIREAFSVFVIGNILNFIEKFPSTKEVADPDNDATPFYDVVATSFEDLRNGFTHTGAGPNTGIEVMGLTEFLMTITEPFYLDDYVDFSFSGVVDNSDGAELVYDFTINLTLKQPYLIDLGIAVEQLEIGMPLSGFKPGVGESDFVAFDYDPAPYADLKGSIVLPLSIKVDASNFSFAPTDDFAFRASVNESLSGMTVHVGFLGMQGGTGPGGEIPEFLLNFPVAIQITDPSSPVHLGFGQTDFAAGGDGVIGFDGSGQVSATNAVAAEDVILSQDVIFSLSFGQNGDDPGDPSITVQVTVTAASTANNLDGGPLTDTQARQNLVDDVNAALAAAGLSGIVSASLNGSEMIVLTLEATDAAVLGFSSQENFDDTGAGLTGNVAFDFSSDVSVNGAILVSVDGGVPVLVTLNFTATGADEASRRTDFVTKLNAALDAAFGGGVLTGSLGGDLAVIAPDNGTSSLEITRTATMSAEFDITTAEFAAADPEDLFAIVPDSDLDFFRITLPLDAKTGIVSSVSLNQEIIEIIADLIVEDGGVITFPLNDDIAEDYIGLERFVLADYLTLSGVDYNSFDPSTDSFQLLLDFNKVGAAEVANMIGQLRGWLERLAKATMLSGYQLPFTEGTLGEVLLFGDMFQYALLFDDGRDGVDPGEGEAPVFNDQGRLLFFVTGDGGKTIVLAFSTAQEFAKALDHLGDDDPVQTVTVAGGIANYDAALKELTYDVRVSAVGTSNFVAPADFELDLYPIHSVVTQVDALISTALFFEATVGLDLKDSIIIDPDTELNGPDGLNNGDGVDIRTDIAVTGAGDVSLITGRLTGNATFTVTTGDGTTEVRVFKSAGPGPFDPSVVVNTGTDTITFSILNPHGLTTGDAVVYDNGGGDDIEGLTDGTTYYVVRTSSTSFQVAESLADAMASTPVIVDITGTGTGTSHTIQHKHNTDGNLTIGDLLDDINEALATAGLGADLEAIAVAGRVVIQAKAAGPERFAISANLNNRAYTELGLPTTMATTVFLTGVDISLTPFRVDGGFIDTAGFRISLNGEPSIAVNVTGLANSNSVADVVNDVNVALQNTLLPDDSPLSNYIVATRNGNRLVLAAIDASIKVFSVSDKTADTEATERLGIATTQLSNKVVNGVFLSPVAGVFFVGENFLDKDINVSAGVPSAFGRLVADQSFTIEVNGTDNYAISITEAETDEFNDLSQLLDLLNGKIAATALNNKVVAYLVGTRFVLSSIDSDITSIEITTTSAVELGLLTAADLGVDEGIRAGGQLRVAANRDAPSYYGPSADAHFTIDYEIGGIAETPVDVTLLLSEALSNRTIYDLVSDVTLALNAAFGGASLNPFVAAFDGQRLVIRPKASADVTAFSITSEEGDPAITDLHLHDYGYTTGDATIVANQFDMLIFTVDGQVHGIVLDGALDIGDVIAAIAADTSGDVTAWVNDLSTGLNLTDNTPALDDIGALFRVETVNGSKAVSGLGLQASSTLGILIQSTGTIDPVLPDDDANRRLIEGDSVGRLEMQDRFFLRQVDADTPFLSAGIFIGIILGTDWEGLPPEVPDSASYGFVGLEFLPSGNVFSIDFAMELNKDGDPLNNVTLTNLLDSLSKDVNGDGFVDIYDLHEVVTLPLLEPRAGDDYLEFDVDLAPGLPSNLATDLALTGAKVRFTIVEPGNPFIQKPGTAAFDAAEIAGIVSVADDDITLTAHGFSLGDKVTYRKGAGGTAIEGLKDNTVYYVIPTGANTFKLAETKAKALSSTAIDLTDFGAGENHRFLRFDTEAPVIDTSTTNFGDLVNFKDIVFGDVLAALQKLRDFLNEFAKLTFLGIPVPVIGVTLNDLLGIASNFAKAVADVTNNPAATLQALTQKLRESFGLPPDSDPIQLALVDDGDGADGSSRDMLKVSLVLDRAYTQAMTIELDFSNYLPDDPIFGAIKLLGRAGLGAKINIDAIFSVGIDLDDDGGGDTMGEVYLFTHENDTSIKFFLDATSSVITFNAALGPLGVLIIGGDGQILIDIGFANGTASPGDKVSILDPTDLLAAFGDFDPSMTSSFEITLPTYFPSASNYLGDIYFKATWDIGDTAPTISDFDYPTDFSLDGFFEQFSASTNLTMIIEALDLFLETLQDILSGEILGLPLPFIGDKLSEGALFIEDLRSKIVAPFKELVSAADKTEAELVDLVQAFLFAILGDGIQAGSQIDQDFPELLSLLQNFEDLIGFEFTKGLGLLSGSDYSLIDTILPVVYTPPNSPFGLEYTLNLGDTITKDLNFDFDLGLPALGLDFDGGLAFEIEWALTIGIGVSTEKGVYINLGQENEFMVSVDAGFTPGSVATGKLGFLQLSAQTGADVDGNGVDDTNHVTATFAIDLQNGNDPNVDTEQILSFFDLGNLEIVAGVEATADLDLLLELAFNKDLLPPVVSAILPALEARFILEWGVEDENVMDGVDLDFANSLKHVRFEDIYLDLGSFLGEFLGPIVSQIQEYTEPLQPIIDILTARIPVLSDLAGKTITLVDIAATFGEFDPGLIYAIADLISFVNSIPANPDSVKLLIAEEFVLVGSGLFGDSKNLLTDPTFSFADAMNPESDSFIGALADAFDSGDFFTGMADFFDDAGGFISNSLGAAGGTPEGQSASGLFGGDFNSDERGGFAFPFLENPASILGALLGNPIVLVTYDLPPLVVEFEWEVSFPIYPPLYGVVGAGLGVKIDLAFGYDTLGVQKFVEGGFSNPLDLLSGFYISDTENPDGSGADVGELQFKGQISVGAELNAGIASAGVTASIILTVDFDLNDPDGDGRVRLSEILGNFLYEWREGTPALAPLAIFDIYGEIAFQLSAYIKILLFEATFNITPKITLFEFAIEFDREPILATERGDGSLLLNIGPNAGARLHGNTSDIGEEIHVKMEGGKVKVWSDQFNVSEDAAQTYELGANKIIVAYGGNGDDTIILEDSVTADVYIEGNSGNDVIEALGSGDAEIYGHDGDDTITGGSGQDVIYGGEGSDDIDGGEDNDIIFGDDGRISEALITALVRDKDGDDTITGGPGRDIIFGSGALDNLAGDGPFVLGNPDSDTSGGGDLIFGDGARLIKDEGDGSSVVDILTQWTRSSYDAPGGRNDIIHGHGGPDVIYAGRGDDIVDGGTGNDRILGGPGFDYLAGAGDSDTIFGGTEDDVIYGFRESFDPAHPGYDNDGGADSGDTIYGEDGNDYIRGNNGDDILWGGRGSDIIFGDFDDDKAFGEEDNDYIFGGADDELSLQGGAGNDIVFGDDGIVVFINFSSLTTSASFVNRLGHLITADGHRVIGDGVFSNADPYVSEDDNNPRTIDVIQTVINGVTDGDDYVVGGKGDDIVFGGAKDDTVFGDFDPDEGFAGPLPIGNDILFGDGGRIEFNLRERDNIRSIVGADLTEVGIDHVSGNAGSDVIFGNGAGDFLYGRMHSSFNGVTAYQEDPLEVRDDDIILGDDGEIDYEKGTGIIQTIETYFKVVDYPSVITVGGSDEIFGNMHDDIAFGGIAGDLIKGDDGLDGDDILIGDNGLIVYGDDDDVDQFDEPLVKIATIETTDVSEITGGADTIEGQDDNDVILGGVNNGGEDLLYGDRSDPTPDSIAADGQDIILGDNGKIYFNYNGDLDLDTLDRITTYLDGRGGTDVISGNAGNDVMFGSTGDDEMYGDDATASAADDDGEDIMFGDNGNIDFIGTVGRLLVQVAGRTTPSAVDIIYTTDVSETTGGADTMSGNAKADIMFGGVNDGGNDVMYGDRAVTNGTTIANDGDDIMLGDNGELDFTHLADTDRMTLDLIRSYEDALGGTDIISGNKGLDVAIGGTGGDTIYGDDATASAAATDLGDLLLGDNADVFLVAPPPTPYPAVSDLKLVLRPAIANPSQPPSAVKTIRTTDTVDPVSTGGIDIISGNSGSDIIAGGVYGDFLYGDRQVPNATTSANDGSDIILGDNGAFEWLSTGRLGDINDGVAYIDIEANNAALWAKYGTNTADTDLTTLDLVTTEQPNSGGRDTIYGDEGDDIIFGGTDLDVIRGDDGDETAETAQLNRDVMFGDHGRIYPQFSSLKAPGQFWQLAFNSRNFFAIDTADGDGGEGDVMWGEEGADIMLGQQGDDRMWGGSGDDDMIGGHNVAGGWDELSAPAVDAVLSGVLDVNDLMDGGTGDDAMAGDNTIMWRRGDDFSPRFRTLTNGKIYTTGPDGVDTIITNVDGTPRSDPADVAGRDIQLVDHSDAVQTTPNGRFGADVMAGGPQQDTIFGQLGNDLIQGDGVIGGLAVLPPFVGYTLGVTDSGANPDTDATLYFNVPEVVTDGNDYIEGNGGSDLLFGGLGQDDIIGGSSALFGLDLVNALKLGYTEEQMRPDDSDIIFGGAGLPARLARNDFVGATDTASAVSETDGARPTNDDPSIALVDRHSRDADFIMGDNANVYRLVNTDALLDAFLEFNYDQSSAAENRGGTRIIVRAMEQLDYTLGGADYEGGTYVNGAAVIDGVADNGAADIIHGESGDDYIFGMTGSDALYGESDDDDVVGGYGHDWISGGTGQDGVLGDDGLLYTSRNSTLGEPLYGVEALLAKDSSTKYSNGNALDELISTPGDIQIALINPTGALKKTADLVPFSFDATWLGMDDEFPDNQDSSPFADDIIFGGLDSDFLHGGSGDDAISGAEALLDARVPTFDNLGAPNGTLNLGYSAFVLPAPIIPGDTAALDALDAGDWLAFNPVDLDGQHLNNRYRAGEFFLYDEYDPRRKIMLTATGELYKNTGGTLGVDFFEFVLNFNGDEGHYRPAGNVPKATGQQTESYPAVNDDGKDAIFGDNGNDWIVGGTGRDNIYGGWGNDLLNADDKHDINDNGTKEVTVSDTQPSFEDRAYGGAGRDILIGNTGGDRLIDWVGEYNTYLVPYAPFGQATVSRTLQPFLPEYLYALSAGDGADFTRYTDAFGGTPPAPTNNNPNPSRNGEPNGELGLVLQKDYAWQDQTGAPADPQAGNIPGGHRDVLRSAGFNDGSSDGFFADSGTWSVKSGVLTVAPQTKGSAALSVFYVDDFVPSYFEVLATVNAVKPVSGYKANAYIIFDYQSETDFKFAGIDVSNSKLVIGQRTESGWTVVKQGVYTSSLKPGTNYNLFLSLNGSSVTLIVDNKVTLTHVFAPRIDADGIAYGLSHGMVGLGADNAKASIDNMIVQRLAPVMTFVRDVDFSSGVTDLFAAPASGTWNLAAGRYDGAAAGTVPAVSLITTSPAPAAIIDLSAVLNTTGAGGFVFDYYNATAFKFVAVDRVAGTVTLGHRTAKGWFTDAVYTNAAIKTSADQNLGLTIKGTTVSVKWNNSLVLSFAFNALATDGATGLLGRSGTTSFNSVKFQTDDPGFQAQAGTTSTGSSASASMVVLSSSESMAAAVTPALPAVSSIATSLTSGPVSGSIVNSLLSTSNALTMVSGFSGTSVTMTPMVTSNLVLDGSAETSIASPLQSRASSEPMRIVGATQPSWTLASVTLGTDTNTTSTSRIASMEAQPAAAEDAAEAEEPASEAQAMSADTGIESIFDLEMMPPVSRGAVEPRKADEAQPDSEDGSEPGRTQPDAD